MLYTLCIVLILVASLLIILAVLVQSPKSGMAANFGASNQVMGVRQTSDFLEKFTWIMAGTILVLSLVATMAMDRERVASSNLKLDADARALEQTTLETEVPAADLPVLPTEAAAPAAAAMETPETPESPTPATPEAL